MLARRALVALVICLLLSSAAGSQRIIHPPEIVQGSLQGSLEVFLDQFAAASNTELSAHPPNTGSAWTEIEDTAGTLEIRAQASVGQARSNGSSASNRIRYEATSSPVLSGQNYNVRARVAAMASNGAGGDDPLLLTFGGVDANDYCGLALYASGQSPDVVLFKVVGGTAFDLSGGSINADPTVGDTYTVQARGADITVFKGSTSILAVSDTDCDNGNKSGLGLGNARSATDDVHSDNGWDDFTIVQIGGVTTPDVPPSITVVFPPPLSPYQTAEASVTISGTASAGTDPIDEVTLACSGATTLAETAMTGTTGWTYNNPLNVGTTTCVPRVYDTDTPTRRVTTGPTLTFIRSASSDTTRPTITWTHPASSPFAATVNPDTLTFQCSDNVACTAATWASDQGGAGGSCTVPAPVGGVSSVSCGPIAFVSGNVNNVITVTAQDGAGNVANVNTTRTITHLATLQITTAATLPNLTQNVAGQSRCVSASGGVAPYVWDVTAGALPTGMSLSGSTSLTECITGTPTTVETVTPTIRVRDSQGSPASASRQFSISVAAATAETAHAYFDFQMTRAACGGAVTTNCVVQIDNCVAQGDNGGCSLRNDTQLNLLTKGTRTADGWHYVFGSDPDNGPDGAKNIIAATAGKIPGPQQLEFPIPTLAEGDTITIVWDEYFPPTWLHPNCGGNQRTEGFKQARLPAYSGKEWGMSRIRVEQLQSIECSENAVGVISYGSQLGVGGTTFQTTEVVTPSAIGVYKNEWYFGPPGRNAHWDQTRVQPLYLAKSATWGRRVLTIKFDVAADSSEFDDWRTDCDPAGVNTSVDAICAAMLATIPDPDSDSKWASVSMHYIDETRGAQRITWRVPWWNARQTFNLFRMEFDGSGAPTVIVGPLQTYLRNLFIIKNITSTDIDDTGCPSSCTGDSGGVSSHLLRKPVP